MKMMIRSVIMITLSILAVEIISYHLTGRQIRELTQVQQTTLTRIYSERIDRKLAGSKEDLRFLADLPAVFDYFKFHQFQLDIEAGEALSSVEEYFRKLIDRQTSYSSVILYNKGGESIVKVLRDEHMNVPKYTDLEVRSIATSTEVLVSLSTIELQGKKLTAERLVAPIAVDAKFEGYIELMLDHDYLLGDMKKYRIFDTGYLFALSNDGRVIYHPDISTMDNFFTSTPNLKELIHNSTLTHGSLELDDQFFSYSRMDDKSGWYIVAVSPKAEMYAVLDRIKTIVFFIVLLNIIIEALFILVFMRVVITKPIRKILDVIMNIEKGNMNHRVNITTSDEIGVLASSFNHMIDEIQEKEAYNHMLKQNLEETVELRTKELIESRNALSLIFENAPVGLVKLDNIGKVIECNGHFKNIFALPDFTSSDLHVKDLLGEQKWQEVCQILSKTNEQTAYNFDTSFVTSEGEQKFIESLGVYSAGDEGRDSFFILAVSDQTDKKKAELQVEIERAKSHHASKMATLGEMAGGIAHEINNPLGIISLRSQQIVRVFKDRPEHMAKVPDFVEEILQTTMRIERIIRGLRSFARSGDRDPFNRVNVSDMINDTLSFCAEGLKASDIELFHPQIPPELTLECRPVQISQVILNLISNARDAVFERKESRQIKFEVNELENEIELSLSNNGPPIPLENRDKIMQPFFTTKEIGKGTGLGLSIAKGIVEDHKGWLFLDPDSEWVRFVIKLPRRQTLG